jgi:transposase InsO family protein
VVSLASRRIVSDYLQTTYRISERRSCQIINLNRATKRNKPQANRDQELRAEIHRLSMKYPRLGYRKIHDLLRDKEWQVGRERVRLIRKQEGLQVIRKQKKKRVRGKSTIGLSKAKYPNHVWSYDLVSDQTACGRRLRCLTVIDEYTRYGLAIYSSRSITSGHIKRVLEELFEKWGPPTCIKSDNGPEFIAKNIQEWLARAGVKTRYIDPGSPWQNGHSESFNAVFRDGCLDRWLFYSVQEARRVIAEWLREYNTERPHGALAGVPPARYVKKIKEKQRKAA